MYVPTGISPVKFLLTNHISVHIICHIKNFDVRFQTWRAATKGTQRYSRPSAIRNGLQYSSCCAAGKNAPCVLMEQLGMGQSAVSYHMRILCRSGIVTSRQEGKWTHYSISPAGSRQAAELLLELTSPAGGKGKTVPVKNKSHLRGWFLFGYIHQKFLI